MNGSVAGAAGLGRTRRVVFARALEESFVAYVLVTSTGAVLPLLALGTDPSLSAEDSALLRLALVPVLLGAPLLALARARAVLAALRDTPLLVLLVVWVACSTLWSVAPEITARRALAFATFSLLAVVLAASFTPRALLERLVWLALALMGASLVFRLALPELGTMSDGAWRGAFTHKNGLGQAANLAVLVLLLAWRHRVGPRPIVLLGLGLALLALVASRSANSLLVTLVGGALLLATSPAFHPLARAAIVSAGFALLAVLALVLLLFPAELAGLLGRDPTLTGRVPLWSMVLAHIQERPWTGWGYQAFWVVPAFAEYVLSTLGWPAPNAHSGYLETALGLGWPGLALVLLLLGQALGRAWRTFLAGDRLLGELALVLLLAFSVRNLVESELLQQSGILWLVSATLLVACRRERARRP
ncbi:MAG: O-antigen ligase family protein [Geminicoccaceae bacterium]|nr:O-antigen ligase family protein [Geminicoccaceae bacterium]MDW8340894.1 O-antigen ligase family protein [Geminicoccaceae bacterium]